MDKPTSTKPGKQRKWKANMPLHKRNKSMSARLSPQLNKKYDRRNLPVRKGDEVKIMRGEFKGIKGEVESVDLKKYKIYVTKVTATKTDGTQVPRPIHPSNVMITDLDLEDEKRRGVLERKDVEVTE